MNNYDRKLPASRLIEFVHILSNADSVSRAAIMEQLNIKKSAFYRYLDEARQYFPIEYVGSIGTNGYYSINKESIAEYFNLQTKP
jgi:predicted DNA-binding transcriptional regulator YafY